MNSKTYILQKLRDCLEELNNTDTLRGKDLDDVISEAEYLTEALKNTKISQEI